MHKNNSVGFGAASLAAMLVLVLATGASQASSLLTLGPRGVQTLVSEQLFSRGGRWYLIDDGACHTYLESPRTRLENDRLVLNAHLTSRLGQPVGNGCAGVDLTSNVTVSGKLRGSDHSLVLDDIRIDRVDDPAARNALDLALQLAPDAIPRRAGIDVLDLMRRQAGSNGTLGVHVDQVQIVSVATRPTGVAIAFDLGLNAP